MNNSFTTENLFNDIYMIRRYNKFDFMKKMYKASTGRMDKEIKRQERKLIFVKKEGSKEHRAF